MSKAALLLALTLGACTGTVTGTDDGGSADASAGDDAGGSDAGETPDAGRDDAGIADAGTLRDAGSADAGTTDDAGPGTGTLSERYPGDMGIGDDPAVLFHDDFEDGWGRWDAPNADTMYLHLETDAAGAQSGQRYLRSTVTAAHLEAQQYISSQTRVTWEPRTEEVWIRFYARFPEVAPNPHHWVRVAAGTPSWNSSGLANTVPPGDEGFWFDFDINNQDQFNFYVYWYEMRSGRCDDGSATPGCAGDQGTTYYYGNVFRPPGQTAFTRDEWFCIEMHAAANTVGSSDGELAFFIDDAPIGEFAPGTPEGTWLRAQFHPGGCEFSACDDPTPFEGFDFRADSDVLFKTFVLDAYYERESSARKRQALIDMGLTPSESQTILYDDVVVATERVGCQP